MTTVDQLKVKIFADGADKAGMLEMYAKPYIKGLTTNPTLMRKAGLTDYRAFSKDILKVIPDKPISFEVFSDEFVDMERQAMEIAGWGDNVYVKIPVTNTRREPSYELVRKLAKRKVKINVTAVMTLAQVRDVVAALDPATPSYVSVFAGRIADTGRVSGILCVRHTMSSNRRQYAKASQEDAESECRRAGGGVAQDFAGVA